MGSSRPCSVGFALSARRSLRLQGRVGPIRVALIGGAVALLAGWLLGTARSEAAVSADDPVVLAAGDIAGCNWSGDDKTAAMLDGLAGTIVTLGDNVYQDGLPNEFADCFAPTWGRHLGRLRPVPGNHDYHQPGGSGYFGYFGALAGEAGKGYYSFDLGGWHLIALNSEIGMKVGSAQEQWLRTDLAAHPTKCTLAYWHEPRFGSGSTHGNDTRSADVWADLYAAGADVVLNGHEHTYERFALQNPGGSADPNGITEFIVGTGGTVGGSNGTPIANSVVFNATTLGILRLTLHPTGYDWTFLPVPGASFTDSGSAACVGGGTPGSAPSGNPGPGGSSGGGGGRNAPADLGVSVSSAPTQAKAGDTVVERLQVQLVNRDVSSGTNGIVLTTTLPAAAQLVSATTTRGPGCGAQGQVVTCNLDWISGSLVAEIELRVRLTAAGTVRTTSIVTSAGQDVRPADNTALWTTTVASPTAAPLQPPTAPPSDIPRIVRKRGVTVVRPVVRGASARAMTTVWVDRAADVSATVTRFADSAPVALLAGSRLGATKLTGPAARLTTDLLHAGAVRIVLSVPAEALAAGRRLSVWVSAVGRNGKRSTVRLIVAR